MLDTFPGLLLEDRLRPFTDEIAFLDLPYREALEAYLDWQRWIRRRSGSFSTRNVDGDLESILHGLEPLRSIEPNRTAVVPTSGAWTAFFDNLDRRSDHVSLAYALSMRTGRRTLRLTVNVNLFDGRPRPTVGLPATNFYFHHGSVERNLSAWVNDNGRWAWEERGEPQLFEQPEHYKARRIRDRLTVAILAEYAGKLGLRPFDASFYSPDEEATIAEFSAPPGSRSTFHTLQDVQARIANGWYTEPRPW